jgi:outer membrane receptor protein involved in Fe transport
VDARAEVSLGKGLSLYGAADNLFDAAVATGVAGDGSVSYDAPRVFRIGLSFRR